MNVRDARPEEFAAIGDLRVAAYRADGFLSGTSSYEPTLRALGTDGAGQILVAVADGLGRGGGVGASLGRGGGVGAGTVLGTVTLMPWPHGQVVHDPHEAEIRALAVAKQARGSGIGRALVTAVIQRAVAWDIRRLLLLTHPDMRAAQHLYAEAGFCRLPDLDWQPGSGPALLAFSRDLGEG